MAVLFYLSALADACGRRAFRAKASAQVLLQGYLAHKRQRLQGYLAHKNQLQGHLAHTKQRPQRT